MAVRTMKNEKGQAIFEFIIFLPLLLVLLSILVTISASINSSINQQKFTRGYYFYLQKGNSTLPSYNDIQKMSGSQIGMLAIGWAERIESNLPVAPCYKMSNMVGFTNEESCDEPLAGRETTNYIRSFTVFGICSEVYSRSGADVQVMPKGGSNPAFCIIQ